MGVWMFFYRSTQLPALKELSSFKGKLLVECFIISQIQPPTQFSTAPSYHLELVR